MSRMQQASSQQRSIGDRVRWTRCCIAILIAIASTVGLATATQAQPLEYTWTGASSQVWDFGAFNWVNRVQQPMRWSNEHIAIFDGLGTGSITVDYGIAPGGIDVYSSGYAFTGGSIYLPGATVFQVYSDVTVASYLDGGVLIKAGNAALTLSGNNTYAGAVVNDGALVGTTSSLTGDITNNALVTFDQGFDGTYSGSMSGSGSLTKLGSGPLTLSGNNSYSGGTTVSAGWLVGTTSSLQGDIASEGMVAFDQNSDGFYAGSMSGSGRLTKLSEGTVTLSGNNSYSGGTFVWAGALVGTTSSLQGTIVNYGVVTFDQDFDGTYSGSMSGIGSLTKLGSGAVTLSGNISYSGGTTVSDGTLVGTTSSLRGNIAIESIVSNVTFDQSTDGSYSGSMYGSGSLTKLGLGTVTLSGANSYSGGTGVLAGTLVGNTQSLQGNIVNEGIVTFDQDPDGTYSGSMSGIGSLIKLGSGAVTLSGYSDYTGTTTVQNGALFVAGTLSSSSVSVQSGGLLGGDGTIGGSVTVQSGGTLAPGNSPGILTVHSLQLDDGSTTVLEINGTPPGSGYDQISVQDTLGYGGVLSLTLSGSYADYTTFDLFTGFTSTSGSFSAVTLSALGTPYEGLSFTISEETPGSWETGWVDPVNPGYHQKIVFSQFNGVLAVVPEPSTYAMAVAASICCTVRVWLRRRAKECRC